MFGKWETGWVSSDGSKVFPLHFGSLNQFCLLLTINVLLGFLQENLKVSKKQNSLNARQHSETNATTRVKWNDILQSNQANQEELSLFCSFLVSPTQVKSTEK